MQQPLAPCAQADRPHPNLMIYKFTCYECDVQPPFIENVEARAFHPPKAPKCAGCHESMSRVYGCQIDTSGCKDVDNIPFDKQVAHGGPGNITSGQAAAIEAKHTPSRVCNGCGFMHFKDEFALSQGSQGRAALLQGVRRQEDQGGLATRVHGCLRPVEIFSSLLT